MVKENILIKMVIYTKVNGLMIKKTVKGHLLIKMVINMLDNLKMIFNMDMEF